jgi:uncharacterized protein YjdB
VRIVPTSSTIDVGGADTLKAEVLDTGGGIMHGQAVTWISATPSVVTVNSAGVVTGVSGGNSVISAAASGLTGTAVVTVRQIPAGSVSVSPSSANVNVGRTIQLTATVRDASGKVLTGRSVIWHSDNLTRATVLPGGLVTGLLKGSVTIRATVDGKTGSSSINVK